MRRPRKNAPADWVRVETWGLQATNLAQYNSKGSRVGVSGRVRSEFYNPEGGERGGQIRSTVVADSIEYIGRPKGAAGEGDVTTGAAAPDAARSGSRR